MTELVHASMERTAMTVTSSSSINDARAPSPATTVAFAEYPLPPSSSLSSVWPFRSGENRQQRAQDLMGSRQMYSPRAQANTLPAERFRGDVSPDSPRGLRAKVEFAFDAAIVAHSVEVAGTNLNKKTAELEKIAAILTKWHTQDLVKYTEHDPESEFIDINLISPLHQAFYEQVLKTMGTSVAIMAELLMSPFEDMASDILENGSGSRPSHGLINAIRAKLGSHSYHQELYEWELRQEILPNFKKELEKLLAGENLDTIKALAFAARQVKPAASGDPQSRIAWHLRQLLVTECAKRIRSGL